MNLMKRWIILGCLLALLPAVPTAAAGGAFVCPAEIQARTSAPTDRGLAEELVQFSSSSPSTAEADEHGLHCSATVRRKVSVQPDLLRAMLGVSTAPTSHKLAANRQCWQQLIDEQTIAFTKSDSNDPTFGAKPPPASAKINRA
jgi:hypothetical protein